MKVNKSPGYAGEVLRNKKLIIDRLISEPSLEKFRKAGLINELMLKYYMITSDYLEFRKKYSHLEALEKTAARYFISPEHVLTVMYRKIKVIR